MEGKKDYGLGFDPSPEFKRAMSTLDLLERVLAGVGVLEKQHKARRQTLDRIESEATRLIAKKLKGRHLRVIRGRKEG